MQNSVSKYSGIKNTSKRLDLSRSMDNATNIINKLQSRIRKWLYLHHNLLFFT
jgi:hypothetical protein